MWLWEFRLGMPRKYSVFEDVLSDVWLLLNVLAGVFEKKAVPEVMST
jgi:hypothetical protein